MLVKSLSPRSTTASSAASVASSLRDWIVVYVLHRNSIYFLLSFWSDATKKNHIFQLSPRFPFHFPDDDQNYTDTYEKRSNEISNVRTFGASVRRLLFSHFCVVLWLVLRKKLRLVHLILKKKRRTRDFGLWVEAEQKLGKVLLFWFSINLSHFLSIFPNPLRSSNNGNTPPAVLMYLTSRSSCRSIKSIWGIWVVWRTEKAEKEVESVSFLSEKKLWKEPDGSKWGGVGFSSNSIWHFMAIDFWMGLCAKKRSRHLELKWTFQWACRASSKQKPGRRTFFE